MNIISKAVRQSQRTHLSFLTGRSRLRSRFALIGLAAIFTCVIGSSAGARPEGAGAGYSGGPLDGGYNCVACHQPFVTGPGRVELIGAPQRYRANALYDLTVRVVDPEQAGAGFQISAEDLTAFRGTWMLTDSLRTGFAGGGDFVTHSELGYISSLINWTANGGQYDYLMRWQAPPGDEGRFTFFLAALAANDGTGLENDRYYARHKTLGFAVPGDADGDEDLDLADFSGFQTCFNGDDPDAGAGCEFLRLDGDDTVSLADAAAFVAAFTGPTALLPGGYVLADPVRGGQLYDNWWNVNGAPAPVGDHPLYPLIGQQAGSVTFRCKECHGWDYKGVDGAYGGGSHFTGIVGVYGTALSPQALFELLKADPQFTPNGHNMTALGMSDADLWDVVRFVFEGIVDTDDYIDGSGEFSGGDWLFGQLVYIDRCFNCHGPDGTDLNFGSPGDPEYVGTIATHNPWELLHKARFGQPGSPMPAMHLLGDTPQDLIDLGAYTQSLPVE